VGALLRIVLAANLVVLLSALMVQPEPVAALLEGTLVVMLAAQLEPPLLFSILCLCGLGTLLRQADTRLQRLLAFLVPAVVFGGWQALMGPLLAPAQSFMPLIMLTAGLGGVFALHYLQLRARALVPASSEARLQVLQARIRPHFLFNSLNAVLGIIRSDPRRAEDTLADLADLFRVFMSDPRRMVSLHDEINLCRQYLAIESLRLGERLRVQWDLPHPLPAASIPQLLLQPLVENAVIHGIEPAASGGTLRISVTRRFDQLILEVSNPVPDQAPSRVREAGNGMALANIRERLALMYDLAADMQHRSTQGEYVVTVKVPYQTHQETNHVPGSRGS
jgi:two-component system sensor histidine kinase AlgZ